MELKGLRINKEGQLTFEPEERKLFGLNPFGPLFPEIILTEEEAKERNLDINNKKGYYTEIEDRLVPIKVINKQGKIISPKK